jgi:hypothetical protein
MFLKTARNVVCDCNAHQVPLRFSIGTRSISLSIDDTKGIHE